MKIDIQKMGELVLCDARVGAAFLNDPEKLQEVCLDALVKGHCNFIEDQVMFYQFREKNNHGDGVTGLIIIKESHFHISTWPEDGLNYVQLDINTCGHRAKALIALGYLLDALDVIKCFTHVIDRGIPVDFTLQQSSLQSKI